MLGNHKSSQSTPSEVQASTLSAGAYQGDVNLFTGTYNSSYTLGSVATVSGLQFTLNLSYSSTFASGDNLPHVSGVPYGEGWNLDLPTISVSVEDYHKYSIWETENIAAVEPGVNPTRKYYEVDSLGRPTNYAGSEGKLYWFAPMLNIPGVASGRLVFKYETQGQYVFVLRTFDRYVEAYFDGTRWEVVLDNGTRYKLGMATVSHRNPSNQRVEPACYPSPSNERDGGGALANLVLPKTEVLSWSCVEIYNRNLVGRIRFLYQSFGKFDFHKVFQQPGFRRVKKEQWDGYYKPVLRAAARDIILTEIRSGHERLVLDYSTIFPEGGCHLLDIRDTVNVERLDSMYASEVVYRQGGTSNFQNWKNYLHIRADGAVSQQAFVSNTNPYLGEVNAKVGYRYRHAEGSYRIKFKEGFLESPRIATQGVMPPGELYEIRTKIRTDVDLLEQGGALYDINLATGDADETGTGPNSGVNGDGYLNAGPEITGYLPRDFYERSRGSSLFSTFSNIVKWHSYATHAHSPSSTPLETSNYFMMPNNPLLFKGFHIQVGPGISDNNFTKEFVGGADVPYICQTYFNSVGYNESLNLNTGHATPQNFGVGLPFHLMMEDFYAHLSSGRAYCSDSLSSNDFWWSTNTGTTNGFLNQPTLTREEISTNNYRETYLEEVELRRYSRTPYMLTGVRKLVFQNGGLPDVDITLNGWRLVSRLGLEYRLETLERYTNYYPAGAAESQPVNAPVNLDRNIFQLWKITQLPLIEGDLSHLDWDIFPKTRFGYKIFSGWIGHPSAGAAISAWQHLNNTSPLTNSHTFNSNYSLLDQVIDPLGKQTKVTYHSISREDTKSYSLTKFRYRLRPSELNERNIDRVRAGRQYSFQTYAVVRSVNIMDEDGVDKKWSYNFINPVIRNDRVPLNSKLAYDWTYSSALGYERVSVEEPEQDGERVRRIYYHHTSESDYLLWGRLYEIRHYDDYDVQLRKQKFTYTAQLAFESPHHRLRRSNEKFNYSDYRCFSTDYCTNDPRPRYTGGDFAVYTDTLLSWMNNRVQVTEDSAVLRDWVAARPLAPTGLTCATPPPGGDCNCHQWEFLDSTSQAQCSQFFNAYGLWQSQEPYLEESDYYWPTPGIIRTEGMYDTPVFYESRFARDIEKTAPLYLNSYFIKKTTEQDFEYDHKCDDSGLQVFKTITEYDYYDATYDGYSDSPGYPAMHQGYARLIQENNGDDWFDPDGDTEGPDFGGLSWEPSWQLYRKTSYSPNYAGINTAYTQEEYFYYYDLLNEFYLQRGGPYPANRHLKTGLFTLHKLAKQDKVRNLPYEVRVTTKEIGQDPHVRSTYYEYDKDWVPENTFSLTHIPNPNGNGWPCDTTEATSNGLPVGGSGWDPNLIVNKNGQNCVYYHASSGPPGYPCRLEGEVFWYCDCSLSGQLQGESRDQLARPSWGKERKGHPRRSAANASTSNQSTSDLFYPPHSQEPYWLQDPYDDPYAGFVYNQIEGKVLLKKVHEQVASGPVETLTFDPTTFDPVFAQEVQMASEVRQRNRYGQVVEEVDALGLVTRYNFSRDSIVEFEDCYLGQHQSLVWMHLNNNVGLPQSVTVGYGLPNALTTTYEYDLKKRVSKVTDPNGLELTYDYDDFGRMEKAYRNGVLLQEVAYQQWQNNTGLDFAQRSHQNYVSTTMYLAAGVSYNEKTFIDPLGRARGRVRDDAVVFDQSIYDNAGRMTLQLKPQTGSLPTIDFTGNATDHTELAYENNFRARLLKTAKNGLSISGTRVVSNAYCRLAKAEVLADLAAAGSVVTSLNGKIFAKVTTTDEDGKTVSEYSDAFGRKVATISLGGTAATVFYYDSRGNVREVINPVGQSSVYDYNYLGQLFRKTTVDGGVSQYAYDQRGQLIAERDAAGETRLYEYDLFGRMVRQARTDTVGVLSPIFAGEGLPWIDGVGMVEWQQVLDQFSTDEKRWYYDTYHAADYGLTPSEVRVYLNHSLTHTNGKLVQSVSYDLAGAPINFKFLSYTAEGFLKWEIDQFNYNGISTNFPGLAVRIDYPRYNRLGNVQLQNVDLNCDQSLDLQYYYTYDSWNRLAEVYAQFDDAKDTGQKVVSYEYDDVKGVVTKRRHYASATGGCDNVEVDAVVYTYENDRYRLTDIQSQLFDWKIHYDAAVGAGNASLTRNYNGNINVTEAHYKLGAALNTPGNFLTPTVYSYSYDALNRLTGADASIEETRQGPLDPLDAGDVTYSYDKVGNFQNLQRVYYDALGNLEYRNFSSLYATGTNRLEGMNLSLNGGAPTLYRTFGYDARGNLSLDSKRNIAGVTYGRANLPWELTRTSSSSTSPHVSYQYDVNDARIYKATRLTPAGVLSGAEYYLRSAGGQELGVYDFNADELHWYVYGADRVAKLRHLPTTNWPGGLDLQGLRGRSDVERGVVQSAAGAPGDPTGPTVLAARHFGEGTAVDLNKPANQEKLALASRLRNTDGSYAFPNNLYYIKERSNGNEALWLDEDWVHYDSTQYELLAHVPLLSERQRLVLEDEWGQPLTLSFGELSLSGTGPEPDPNPGPQDPFTENLPGISDAPLVDLTYYVYDHLGNTRVTYRVDLDVRCLPTYTLQHVQDYYPYGESLRKFVASSGGEKFLSTQHERDEETGFDYRGARFYDGESGRFLSLDPLAVNYPTLSDYVYVANNPLIFVDPDGRKFVNPYEDAEVYQEEADRLTMDLENAKANGSKEDVKAARKAIKKFGKNKIRRVDKYKKVNKLLKDFEAAVGKEEYAFFENLTFEIFISLSSDANREGKEDGVTKFEFTRKQEFNASTGKLEVYPSGIVGNRFTVILFDQTIGTLGNELGDVKFAVEQPKKSLKQNINKVPYWEKSTTKFSTQYESFVKGERAKPSTHDF